MNREVGNERRARRERKRGNRVQEWSNGEADRKGRVMGKVQVQKDEEKGEVGERSGIA